MPPGDRRWLPQIPAQRLRCAAAKESRSWRVSAGACVCAGLRPADATLFFLPRPAPRRRHGDCARAGHELCLFHRVCGARLAETERPRRGASGKARRGRRGTGVGEKGSGERGAGAREGEVVGDAPAPLSRDAPRPRARPFDARSGLFPRAQGGGVHGNAILTKFDVLDVAVLRHRCGPVSAASGRGAFRAGGEASGRGGRGMFEGGRGLRGRGFGGGGGARRSGLGERVGAGENEKKKKNGRGRRGGEEVGGRGTRRVRNRRMATGGRGGEEERRPVSGKSLGGDGREGGGEGERELRAGRKRARGRRVRSGAFGLELHGADLRRTELEARQEAWLGAWSATGRSGLGRALDGSWQGLARARAFSRGAGEERGFL